MKSNKSILILAAAAFTHVASASSLSAFCQSVEITGYACDVTSGQTVYPNGPSYPVGTTLELQSPNYGSRPEAATAGDISYGWASTFRIHGTTADGKPYWKSDVGNNWLFYDSNCGGAASPQSWATGWFVGGEPSTTEPSNLQGGTGGECYNSMNSLGGLAGTSNPFVEDMEFFQYCGLSSYNGAPTNPGAYIGYISPAVNHRNISITCLDPVPTPVDYEAMTCNGTDYLHRYYDRAACCEDLSDAELGTFLSGLDDDSIEAGCNAHQYYK